nr:ribulose-phosphate 3-epimerase [bacterium]
MNDTGTIRIAPSLLSADFARLAEELERVEAAGCEIVHLDIMDGHFVPNISFGPGVCAAVRRATGLFLDAHLMIDDPGFYLRAFVDAGVDEITIHPEIEGDYRQVLAAIAAAGVKAGVALRPATPVETVRETLPLIDHLLIMSVEPG